MWWSRWSPTASLSLCASLAVAVYSAPARTVCVPEPEPGSETAALVTEVRVAVVLDVDEPHVIVQCAVSRGVGTRALLIPLSRAPGSVSIADGGPGWENLWAETGPQAVRHAVAGPVETTAPVTPDSPEVVGVLPAPPHAIAAATASVVERAALGDAAALPPDTDTLIRVRWSEGAIASDEAVWAPPVRIPLAEGAAETAGLPLAIASAPQARISFLVLSRGRLAAPAGSDPWPSLREGEDPVAGLIVPALNGTFRPEQPGGFEAFYERRLATWPRDSVAAAWVLVYAGPLSPSGDWLARPFSGALALDRAVRVELRGALDGPLLIEALPPMWFRAVWVAVEVEEAPPVPDEVPLDVDSMLFTFGAEPPEELTPLLIRRSVEARLHELERCNPQSPAGIAGEGEIVVEPGGTVLGAFARFGDASVEECVVDALRSLRFPVATGPPLRLSVSLDFDPVGQ